jgi:hypothetical protein
MTVEETGPVNDDATKIEAEQPAKPEEKVTYSVSPGFSSFLGARRIALAISSYQSGKFYLLGQNLDGGLMVHERFFRKAMGIFVPGKDTILLATLFQIIKFKNALNPGQQINNLLRRLLRAARNLRHRRARRARHRPACRRPHRLRQHAL